MLTESELAWLVQRNPRGKVGAMFFSCHNCDEADKNPRRTKFKTCRYSCKIHKTHKYELQDALEFSERVAVKLAEYAGRKVDVDQCFTCPAMDKNCHWGVRLSCEELLLQAARIEVEEEMDGKA